MTTLAAYLTPVDLTALKAYLGVTTSAEDTRLTRWYTTAIEWCNEKLSKFDFVDSTGASTDPPNGTVTAVFEYVRVRRDVVNLIGIGKSATGIKKVQTGARVEEYFGGADGLSATLSAQRAAWAELEPYCEPTMFASGGAGF